MIFKARANRGFRFCAAILAALASFQALSSAALADSPAATVPAKSQVIVLVIGSLPADISAPALRVRLAGELSTPMVDAVPEGSTLRGELFLDTTETGDISARFEAPDGVVTQRVIALPAEPARAMDTIVLLAGNVARDEAAELRAELARRRGTNRPSPPESPSTPEPPAPPHAPVPPVPAMLPAPGSLPLPPHLPPLQGQADDEEDDDDFEPSAEDGCSSAGLPEHYFGGDFVPMLGSSLAARNAVRHMSFNLIGGLSGGLRGAEIGSAFNIVRGHVCGFQLAGAVNVTTGQVRGLQIAGAVNTSGDAHGLQIAGAANITAGRFYGVQIAGGANITTGPVSGLQIAGAVNTGARTEGLQIAGGLNLSRRLEGLQLAPINLAVGHAYGAQLGVIDFARSVSGAQLGVVDIAGGVKGFQLGVVNVAGKVHGAQIGVLNVAEDSDFSLGVLSIVRKGRLHLDVWGAETGLFTAAVKHGGRYFHNFYGVGIRPLDGKVRVAFTLGIGGHIPLNQDFFLDIDSLAYTIHRADNFGLGPALLAQGRVVAGLRLTKGFAVIAGPTYNMSVAQQAADANLSAIGSDLVSSNASLTVRSWPGFALGVQTL